jgi:hypothetical protein
MPTLDSVCIHAVQPILSGRAVNGAVGGPHDPCVRDALRGWMRGISVITA